MPKTTTKKTTAKKAKKDHTREVRFPPELNKMLHQLFDAMEKGGLKGMKMARIKCPGCEGINFGVAWSKATGWMVLCDECHSCEKLDNIQPIDPETCEVGTERKIPLKSEAKVN